MRERFDAIRNYVMTYIFLDNPIKKKFDDAEKRGEIFWSNIFKYKRWIRHWSTSGECGLRLVVENNSSIMAGEGRKYWHIMWW